MNRTKYFGSVCVKCHEKYAAIERIANLTRESYSHKHLPFLPATIFKSPFYLPEKLERSAIHFLSGYCKPPSSLAIDGLRLENKLWRRSIPKEFSQRRGEFCQELQKRVEVEKSTGVEDPIDESVEIENSRLLKLPKSDIEQLMKNMPSIKPIRYNNAVLPDYAVSRLAPNYATSCRVLAELKLKVPNFHPRNMLDFGSGLGTFTWAAHVLWPSETLVESCMVDASSSMLDASLRLMLDGKLLAVSENAPCFSGIVQRQFLPVQDKYYDLVVCGFTLFDLGLMRNRNKYMLDLWSVVSEDGFMVIVEQGTTAGFQLLLQVRDLLVNTSGSKAPSAQILAPCPHSFQCPKNSSICNFVVKFKKFDLTQATDTMVNEIFSYLILYKRGNSLLRKSELRDIVLPRVVSYQLTRKAKHFTMKDLCTSHGVLERVVFMKRKCNGILYDVARRSLTGDQIPIETILDDSNQSMIANK